MALSASSPESETDVIKSCSSICTDPKLINVNSDIVTLSQNSIVNVTDIVLVESQPIVDSFTPISKKCSKSLSRDKLGSHRNSQPVLHGNRKKATSSYNELNDELSAHDLNDNLNQEFFDASGDFNDSVTFMRFETCAP